MAARVDLPVEDLVRAYEHGASLQQLASRYGVAVGTIRQRLREAGVPMRLRGAPRRPIDINELVYRQHLCESTRATARELHVSHSTVERRLAELTGVEVQ